MGAPGPWSRGQWARLVSVLLGSLAAQCLSVAMKQTWPLVASLGYGMTAQGVGEMYSLRMFAIMVAVGGGGYLQGLATPRRMVVAMFCALAVVGCVWALPATVLPLLVFKVGVVCGVLKGC